MWGCGVSNPVSALFLGASNYHLPFGSVLHYPGSDDFTIWDDMLRRSAQLSGERCVVQTGVLMSPEILPEVCYAVSGQVRYIPVLRVVYENQPTTHYSMIQLPVQSAASTILVYVVFLSFFVLCSFVLSSCRLPSLYRPSVDLASPSGLARVQ